MANESAVTFVYKNVQLDYMITLVIMMKMQHCNDILKQLSHRFDSLHELLNELNILKLDLPLPVHMQFKLSSSRLSSSLFLLFDFLVR